MFKISFLSFSTLLLLVACASPSPHQERRKHVTDALRDVKNIEKGQFMKNLFAFENRFQKEQHLFEVLGWGNDSTGQVLVLYKDLLNKTTDVQEINREGQFSGGSIEDADADSLFEIHLNFKGAKPHKVICEVLENGEGIKPCNREELDA